MNIEHSREREKEIFRECLEWLYTNLVELAGIEFEDEEIKDAINNYLAETGKNIMELNQKDKENIYSDILQKGLDEYEI